MEQTFMCPIEKPSCYTKNDDTYPLCKGNEKALHDCKQCCLYENMEEVL